MCKDIVNVFSLRIWTQHLHSVFKHHFSCSQTLWRRQRGKQLELLNVKCHSAQWVIWIQLDFFYCHDGEISNGEEVTFVFSWQFSSRFILTPRNLALNSDSEVNAYLAFKSVKEKYTPRLTRETYWIVAQYSEFQMIPLTEASGHCGLCQGPTATILKFADPVFTITINIFSHMLCFSPSINDPAQHFVVKGRWCSVGTSVPYLIYLKNKKSGMFRWKKPEATSQ